MALVKVEKCGGCGRLFGERHRAMMPTPTDDQLEAMANRGIAKATDGCLVEAGGKCPHEHYSWLTRSMAGFFAAKRQLKDFKERYEDKPGDDLKTVLGRIEAIDRAETVEEVEAILIEANAFPTETERKDAAVRYLATARARRAKREGST